MDTFYKTNGINMTFKMFLLAFSVLLTVQSTLGKFDCDTGPFKICERPKVFDEIPREISEFNVRCAETKHYMRCIKEYHDECGTRSITLFRSPELFEATYGAISDVCEEGTLLNAVATENLKCLNETFGKTTCHKGADDFVEPLIKLAQEVDDYTLSIFCLEETHATDCVLRALSENCGRLVEMATLEFIRRSQSLEYACTVRGAKSVLDELNNLNLSEDKKSSFNLLLKKLVEENSD